MDELIRLLTIDAMAQRYQPAVTVSSLRWQLRQRDVNGLAKAHVVTKRSGRWLIHSDRYFAWLMGSEASRAA